MLQTLTSTTHRSVRLPLDGAELEGDLIIPPGALGLVVFAHGSGSSRFSPRNQAVAEQLRAGRLATLLLDLLTRQEERRDAVTAQLRFDIPFLAHRLLAATDWTREHPEVHELPIGYFGASTGAAAALIAAAHRPREVRAVVSRGGRPDLAGDALEHVQSPTLLIVGGDDTPVLDLNRLALGRLGGVKQLAVIPRATHLFEEPGAMDRVADLARRWFERYLVAQPAQQPLAGEPW